MTPLTVRPFCGLLAGGKPSNEDLANWLAVITLAPEPNAAWQQSNVIKN